MHHAILPRLILLLVSLALLSAARADDTALIAAVRAADDARVTATIAADPAGLAALYSDQLHYAHSNGLIDTKASFVESLTSGKTDYQQVDYVQRDFIPLGPGSVLMKGRALVRVGIPDGSMLIDLNFLAVWREEGGRWRFLAWQSSRNPAPAKKP